MALKSSSCDDHHIPKTMTPKTTKFSSKTHIPEEVLVQILAKLPPKSVLRFRSVSKAWCALIDGPFFKDHHLNFINTRTISDFKHLCHFNLESNDPSLMQTTFLMGAGDTLWNINNPPSLNVYCQLSLHGYKLSKSNIFIESKDRNKFTSKILDPVNGIYCVMIKVRYYNGCTLLLWNPGVQQFHVLPRLSPLILPPKIATYFDNHERENQNLIYGFGYDPSTDDYKIILMTELGNEFYETYIHYCFHLYSLSTNVWKQLDPSEIDPLGSVIDANNNDGAITFVHDIRCSFYGDKEAGVYSNGACHWYLSGNRSIFTFDFGDSTFKVTALPHEITEAKEWHPTLATTNGCLALVYPFDCTNPRCMDTFTAYDVYIMKGNVIEKSWMKTHRIDLEDSPGRFIGIVGDEFFVGKDLYDKTNALMKVVSYSLGRKEGREYGSFWIPWIRVLPYQESVISVKPHQKNKRNGCRLLE